VISSVAVYGSVKGDYAVEVPRGKALEKAIAARLSADARNLTGEIVDRPPVARTPVHPR